MCGPNKSTVVTRDGINDSDMKVDFGPPTPKEDRNYNIEIINGEFHFFGMIAARNLPLEARFVPESTYTMQVGSRFHTIVLDETNFSNCVDNYNYHDSPDWKVGVLGEVMELDSTCCMRVSQVPAEAQGAQWWGDNCGYLDRFYRMGAVSVLRVVNTQKWIHVHGCGAVHHFQVKGDFQGYLGPQDSPTALVFTEHVVQFS